MVTIQVYPFPLCVQIFNSLCGLGLILSIALVTGPIATLPIARPGLFTEVPYEGKLGVFRKFFFKCILYTLQEIEVLLIFLLAYLSSCGGLMLMELQLTAGKTWQEFDRLNIF